ncbi:hypothetical protein AB0K11_08535 [Mycobacterium sp. NPDC050551]|jgi:hypothetical protein|uniref:hypothetical protein n=1 Tax=Mycobacterium sp. NPDC050551 TaxID=3155407 RepID=UPI003438AB7B
MTASIEPRRRAAGAASSNGRRGWWRHNPAARTALAAAFMAMLLAVVYATGQWANVVASLAGFATAITLIAVGMIGWERIVGSARSAGLIEQ